MPRNRPTSMEKSPTDSETRPPWTMRAKTSRPNSSVPSQCSADGGRSVSNGLVRVGECGRSAGPKTTISTMSTSTVKAMRPNGCLSARAKNRLRRRTGAVTGCVISTSDMADPRVYDHVQEVHDQVDHHDDRSGQHGHAEDHGVVAAVGSLDRQAAYARVTEDALDDHRTREENGRDEAQHGRHGHEGVAEHVLA